MVLDRNASLIKLFFRFRNNLRDIFPDRSNYLRGLFFFGSVISFVKMVVYFLKLNSAIEKSPDAKFQHEALFARFRASDNKVLYGQNLTKNQNEAIKYLKNAGLREDQIFSLLLGRYLKPQGDIAVNSKLEVGLILLVLFLVGVVLTLLFGMAYDLIFHTAGSVLVRLMAWAVVALITIIPTIYFSLLLLRPPAAYYMHRSLIEHANATNSQLADSKVMNLH